jgi:hypothetical protein
MAIFLTGLKKYYKPGGSQEGWGAAAFASLRGVSLFLRSSRTWRKTFMISSSVPVAA